MTPHEALNIIEDLRLETAQMVKRYWRAQAFLADTTSWVASSFTNLEYELDGIIERNLTALGLPRKGA